VNDLSNFDGEDEWDDLEDVDPEDDEENDTQESYRMLGLCPHGCADDEDCDVPGCPGGANGFDD